MAWLRLFSHGFHGIHRSFVASVLPRNSRNSQKFCCVGSPTEFTEFTEVLLRRYSHGIHRIHRSFVALVLPQNSRNSQKFCCVAFFYKLRECSVGGASLPECSVCSVGSVGGTSLPEGSVCSVRSVGDIPVCFVSEVLALTFGKAELRQLDSRGSVGMAGCHTLLHLCKSVLSVGDSFLPEGSVRSVRSVGI